MLPAPLRARLDRFTQWDLVTVTPWGAPVIAPVGARLVDADGILWTSTTVGFAAKLRNLEAHPRAAALLAVPGQPPVLVRGEATLHGGDGTQNLRRLFALMEGPGGTRPFFGTTATDPRWRWLYRAYWHRVLIGLRVVELWTTAAGASRRHRLGRWSRSATTPPSAPARRAHRPAALREAVDRRGRGLLEDGLPVALAWVEGPDAAPFAWPAAVRPRRDG